MLTPLGDFGKKLWVIKTSERSFCDKQHSPDQRWEGGG